MNQKFVSLEDKLLKKAIRLARKYPWWNESVDRAVDEWCEAVERKDKAIEDLLKDLDKEPK